MITGITESKSIYHVKVNVNLMEVNANKINVGITVNVDVTLENIKYVKKIIFGALVYVVAKMVKY